MNAYCFLQELLHNVSLGIEGFNIGEKTESVLQIILGIYLEELFMSKIACDIKLVTHEARFSYKREKPKRCDYLFYSKSKNEFFVVELKIKSPQERDRRQLKDYIVMTENSGEEMYQYLLYCKKKSSTNDEYKGKFLALTRRIASLNLNEEKMVNCHLNIIYIVPDNWNRTIPKKEREKIIFYSFSSLANFSTQHLNKKLESWNLVKRLLINLDSYEQSNRKEFNHCLNINSDFEFVDYLLTYILELHKLPYISLEPTIQVILSLFMPEIITEVLKSNEKINGYLKDILLEADINTREGVYKGRVDYLLRYKNEKRFLLIELKTDDNTFNPRQYDTYMKIKNKVYPIPKGNDGISTKDDLNYDRVLIYICPKAMKSLLEEVGGINQVITFEDLSKVIIDNKKGVLWSKIAKYLPGLD
jgi:hypothetical protein